MTILFLLALLLAWPTAGLSLVAYIALFFALAYLQAKTRMHHAAKLRAQRTLVSGQAGLPSWMASRDKIETFVYGVQNVAEHRGVPKLFSAKIMNDQDAMGTLMHYAGALEAEGASFIEQQAAVTEKLILFYQAPVSKLEAPAQAVPQAPVVLDNKMRQVQKLRQWLENETSWHQEKSVSDDDLIHSKSLVLGSAVYGELWQPKVSNIPIEILIMEELEDLHLQYNELDMLPAVICHMSGLKKLRLGGNRLTSLPASIGKLRKLELLTLWANDLQALPAEIGDLRNLKALNISHNDELLVLPESITQLENLENFDWYGPGDKTLTEKQKEWLIKLRSRGCKITLEDEKILETDLSRVFRSMMS